MNSRGNHDETLRTDWSLERIQQLIYDKIEESNQLDYKAAKSLDRSDRKKTEIAKDISAMANAGGGTIIYGISEYQDRQKKHLPEKIDPVNQSEYSKEWLGQMASLIRPKIDGLEIYPVHIGPESNDYCYVVEVPMGKTAHQATDFRYYRRRNFESLPMEDYEIREVMARKSRPEFDVIVQIILDDAEPYIIVNLLNVGSVLVRFFKIYVLVPMSMTEMGYYPVGAKTLINKDGECGWLWSEQNDAHSPLLVEDQAIFKKTLEMGSWKLPDNTVSITDIRIDLFSDGMEKVSFLRPVEDSILRR